MRRLGSGSWGTVYRDGHLARKVAADEDAVEHLRRQSEILSRLDHPGIVRVVETGTDHRGWFSYSMPVLGRPLDRYVDGRRIGVPERLRLFGQVLDAIEHIHGRGMVHGGLHLGNVLVDCSGRPVVIDVENYEDASVADDLRRLGVILRYLIVGGPVHGDGSPSEYFHAPLAVFRSSGVVDLRRIAAAADPVVLGCVRGEFGSVAELRDALTSAGGQPKREARNE